MVDNAAGNGSCDTYVVRIYRRDSDPSPVVAGVIEHLSSGRKRPFKSPLELVELLTSELPGSIGD